MKSPQKSKVTDPHSSFIHIFNETVVLPSSTYKATSEQFEAGDTKTEDLSDIPKRTSFPLIIVHWFDAILHTQKNQTRNWNP